MNHSLYRSDLLVATGLALAWFVATVSLFAFSSAGGPARAQSLRLDPNLASLNDLTAIPGVGLPTAVLIVQGRPLARLSDLERLLGEKRARRIAPYLILD